MRLIKCNYCGQEFEVDLQDAGRPVKVPGIGEMVTVRCDKCGKWLAVKVKEDSEETK